MFPQKSITWQKSPDITLLTARRTEATTLCSPFRLVAEPDVSGLGRSAESEISHDAVPAPASRMGVCLPEQRGPKKEGPKPRGSTARPSFPPRFAHPHSPGPPFLPSDSWAGKRSRMGDEVQDARRRPVLGPGGSPPPPPFCAPFSKGAVEPKPPTSRWHARQGLAPERAWL